MDFISIQENKSSLEGKILRAINAFEEDTEKEIEEIVMTRLDGINKATGIQVKLKRRFI